MINKINPIYTVIAALGIVLVIVFGVYIFINTTSQENQIDVAPTSSPSVSPSESESDPKEISLEDAVRIIKNTDIKSVEVIPITPGIGVDKTNPIMQESIDTISDLNISLPFEDRLSTSTGIETYIVINDSEFQETTWTLQILIQGIDYQVPNGNQRYEDNRVAFLESAAYTLQWIQDQGVNPDAIIIKWNQRLIEQERSEDWITSIQ